MVAGGAGEPALESLVYFMKASSGILSSSSSWLCLEDREEGGESCSSILTLRSTKYSCKKDILPLTHHFLTNHLLLVRQKKSFRFIILKLNENRRLSLSMYKVSLETILILVLKQGWAFCIAIYRESNILHPLETSENIAISEDIAIFLRYFLCMILANFDLT